jgi:hypothetical protein
MALLDRQVRDFDLNPDTHRRSVGAHPFGAAHPAAALRTGRSPPTRGACPPSPGEYISNIPMPTSVHIPKPLLEAVDRRARALRISRNHLIVLALEREMKQVTEWSPGFFERLVDVDEATAKSVDELLVAVKAARRSKEPQRL